MVCNYALSTVSLGKQPIISPQPPPHPCSTRHAPKTTASTMFAPLLTKPRNGFLTRLEQQQFTMTVYRLQEQKNHCYGDREKHSDKPRWSKLKQPNYSSYPKWVNPVHFTQPQHVFQDHSHPKRESQSEPPTVTIWLKFACADYSANITHLVLQL